MIGMQQEGEREREEDSGNSISEGGMQSEAHAGEVWRGRERERKEKGERWRMMGGWNVARL